MQKYLVVFLWTHCSWKSSYAREMIQFEKCKEVEIQGQKLTIWDDCFALWHYHAQCWWCDWFWPLRKTKESIIRNACERDEKLMVIEWFMLLSQPVLETIRQAQIMSWRKVFIVYLEVSEKEALRRLSIRNWWKQVWPWILEKKRWYDRRIDDLKKLYDNENYRFIKIDTEKIKPKESSIYIKENFIK